MAKITMKYLKKPKLSDANIIGKIKLFQLGSEFILIPGPFKR